MAIMASSKKKRLSNTWRKFLSEPGFAVLTIILMAAIFLFIVTPVIAVLLKSIGFGTGTLTLEHYKNFFSNTFYLRSLKYSVLAAVITTIVVTFLSVTMSIYVTRSTSKLATIYRGASLLPLVAPPFIFSLALIILFGRNGVLTPIISGWLGVDISIYGFGGVVIAQIIGYFPVGYMLVESTLRNMSQDVEHVSRDLGASQWTTLRRVTLPLAKSGIIKSALLVFVMAIADFSNPLIIGGDIPFLASEAYLAVVGQNNMELAAVLSVFLIIPSFVIFIFQTYFLKDNQLETISGGSGGLNLPLNKTIKTIVVTISTIFIGFIALVFAVVVLGAFVKTIGVNNEFTLDHFQDRTGWSSIYTSVIVSLFAAILAAILGLLQGYLFARKTIPGKKVLEFLTLFGLAVPGTVMGIGYVLVFNGSPFFLTGTVLLIVLNMTFRKIGVGLEAAISKMHQIDSSMEEASSDLGAGPYRTFMRVVVPLLSPSFVVGFVYTFMTAMVSVSSVIFLISPGTNIAAVHIFTLAQHAKIGSASAMSFILIAIVVACMGVLKWIEKRTGTKI